MQLVRENVQPLSGSSFFCLDIDQSRFDSHYHHHPEFEITWIVESEGQRLIGDATESFRKDDLVLIGGGLPHQYHSWEQGRSRAKVILFRRDAFGPGFFDLPECAAVKRLLDEAARGVKFSPEIRSAAFRSISRTFSLEPGVGQLTELLQLLQGLSLDAERSPIASPAYAEPVAAKKVERLQRVLNFIERHWQQSISLDEVAKAAALHPQSLSRFFRQHLGMNFRDYLIRLRLSRAARLLLETDRTVADIAFACGFNNLANFNRHFLIAYQQPPKAYRKR